MLEILIKIAKKLLPSQ